MATRSELYKKAKALGWTVCWNRSCKSELLLFISRSEANSGNVEEKKMINKNERKNISENIVKMTEYQPEILKTKNLVLKERFNAKKLAWIIDNIDIVRKQIIEKDPSRWNEDWNPLPSLKRYYDSSGERKVEYKQKSFGRLFSYLEGKGNVGLQAMAREFRHTIASEFYHDLDMKNAHPVILQHLCKKIKIKTPLLDQYIENREDILRKIGSRDATKIQILKLTNGGKGSKNVDNQWLNKYESEMKFVHNEFSKMNAFKHFEKRNQHNGKAKWMNILLCRYEHILLMTIKECFGNPNDCVLCFDGIMLTKDVNINIESIENVIFEKHGINMQLAIKPMNDCLVTESKHNQIESSNKDITSLLLSAHTDEDYARCFIKLYSNFVVYDKRVYQFIKEKHRWISGDEDLIFEFLGSTMYRDLRQILDTDFKSIDNAKQHAEISKQLLKLCNWSSRKGIVMSIIAKVTTNEDLFDLNCDLIGFSNGVYDSKTHIFRDGVKEDYITMTTGYNYSERDDRKVATLHKFLDSIFPDSELKKFTLKGLSTGIWGKTVQNLFILTGAGSNGKDTLVSKLFARTLGNDYFYVSDNSVITERRRFGGPNVALSNMNKKRFILFNEPDKKSLLQGAQIKQFTGTDKINARGLYSSNTETIIHATSAVLCNDIPSIDNVDGGVVRRLCLIPFESIFKPQEDIKNYENKTNVFPINAHYDTIEFFNENKMTLFHILTDYFRVFQSEGFVIRNKPAKVLNLSEEYLQDCDDFTGWLEDNIEKSETEFVRVRDLFHRYKESDYYRNLSKREKRKNNNKNFLMKIQKHPITRLFFKAMHESTSNGHTTKRRNVLMCYKIREHDFSDDDSDNDF